MFTSLYRTSFREWDTLGHFFQKFLKKLKKKRGVGGRMNV